MVGLKIVLCEIGLALGYLFGEINGLFTALLILTVLDYVSGVIKSIIKKNVSSEIGYKGILKKIGMFVVVALANIVDKVVFNNSLFLRHGILILFISNEGVSIIENLACIGVPIPKSIINVLEQVKKSSKTDNASKNDMKELKK